MLLAQIALAQGHTVIATARSLSKFPQSLKDSKADLIEIEITAPGETITAAIDAAVVKHGRIDVLVNNAGFGHMGALEETSEKEARYQFDINVFGLFNFTKAVLPHMRKQGSGVIAQISSAVGLWAGHGAPVYAASKFAVEGLNEALALEVKSFGIRVHLVEPGIFRTEFLSDISKGKTVGNKVEGYLDINGLLADYHGYQPGDPEKGAQRIYEVVTGTGMAVGMEWDVRVPLGSDAMVMGKDKLKSLTETLEKMEAIAKSTDF